MTIISNKIDEIFPLPAMEKALFLSRFERIEVQKGAIVINAEKIERYVYFIEKGIARAFRETDKGQTTIWFGEAGGVMLSFMSFFKNKPGYESIEVLEDSILYRISSNHLQELYSLHLPMANWGRKFAEQELLLTEQRFMDLQFKTATARYQDLMKHSPTILQRVQLGHIASYLGITQVSLSRIRAAAK
ncbi:Crp/Fnr family transcriptional regulator [Pedobacter sp. SL55]|uniref:Crp/Fnr family transcriptional regulator n=1 Tax=Pedobacter sp. SL55 TaxID=2995161 RepID=UPI002270EFC9|nr:Crp/Fnr family transcriptional regulator [Pedobacter sp. SL55]WAC41852.1 Crp/Fnr family transcriptional regulator [Pedobacter sp. SL55]